LLHRLQKDVRKAGIFAGAAAFLPSTRHKLVLGIAGRDSPGLGDAMIKTALVGLSLVVNTAAEPHKSPLDADTLRNDMSVQQKNAALQPLMRQATDCIVRAVSGDPQFKSDMEAAAINELIVSSMGACLEPMHAMIDAYDRMFGDGAGQAFFMGPYLEVLPRAVVRQVRSNIN
jgi:hypothetical protein